MRYALCGLAAVALAALGVALVAGGAYSVARTGTCAAGELGAVPGRCGAAPMGDVAALLGGFAVVATATAVFMARGRGRDGLPAGSGFAGAAWGAVFLTVAAAVWTAGHGDGAHPGAPAGTGWIAAAFAALGAPLVVLGLRRAFTPRRDHSGRGDDPDAAMADLAEAVEAGREGPQMTDMRIDPDS